MNHSQKESIAVLVAAIVCGAVLGSTSPLWAETEDQEAVPRTFDEAGDAFRQGGRELGTGFRGIGRGLKNTFTGQPAADDYRQGKDIGYGFKDLGRGVAGGARALGRGIKRSFTAEGEEQD